VGSLYAAGDAWNPSRNVADPGATQSECIGASLVGARMKPNGP